MTKVIPLEMQLRRSWQLIQLLLIVEVYSRMNLLRKTETRITCRNTYLNANLEILTCEIHIHIHVP